MAVRSQPHCAGSCPHPQTPSSKSPPRFTPAPRPRSLRDRGLTFHDMSSSTATACASWWTRSRPASAPRRRPIFPVRDMRPPRVAASRYRPSQSARWNRVSDPALPPSFLFRYLCGLIDGALVAATTVIVHLFSHIASKGPRNG